MYIHCINNLIKLFTSYVGIYSYILKVMDTNQTRLTQCHSLQSHSCERNLMYQRCLTNFQHQVDLSFWEERKKKVWQICFKWHCQLSKQLWLVDSRDPFHRIVLSGDIFVSLKKKKGLSIKKKLLELEQLRRLRCRSYKQFNIWSTAAPCTLPWLFAPTVPLCDCLSTPPGLDKTRRKQKIVGLENYFKLAY